MVATLRIRFNEADAIVFEVVAALEDLRSLTALYTRAWGSVFGTTRNRDELKDGEDGARLNVSYDAHKEAFLSAAQTKVGASLV